MIQQPIFIISGEQGEGKTTKLEAIVELLISEAVPVKGFTAPGKWADNLRSSFLIKNISTGESKLLCQSSAETGFFKIGRFCFDLNTIIYGEQLINSARVGELVIIDEVGRFEIKGFVWGPVLKSVLQSNDHPIILTIRNSFIEDVLKYFKISNYFIFSMNETPKEIVEKIMLELQSIYPKK